VSNNPLGSGVPTTKRTVNARARKDLASFTSRPQSIAFDLEKKNKSQCDLITRQFGKHTFRFRQLLQFIASRGSLLILRTGKRSMPIWGLDMVSSSTAVAMNDCRRRTAASNQVRVEFAAQRKLEPKAMCEHIRRTEASTDRKDERSGGIEAKDVTEARSGLAGYLN